MTPFESLLAELSTRGLRFVVVGVSAANYYARSGGTLFATQDRDLLLPADPATMLSAWEAARAVGFELWAGPEPLGTPVDLQLARRVVEAEASTEAVHPEGEHVDLMLAMAGFDFDSVWRERRRFKVGEVEVPVARLLHVVQAEAAADRPKDRLFLATYREALEGLLAEDEEDG